MVKEIVDPPKGDKSSDVVPKVKATPEVKTYKPKVLFSSQIGAKQTR